eukprot:4050291-Prymnesium_polylepis.2
MCIHSAIAHLAVARRTTREEPRMQMQPGPRREPGHPLHHTTPRATETARCAYQLRRRCPSSGSSLRRTRHPSSTQRTRLAANARASKTIAPPAGHAGASIAAIAAALCAKPPRCASSSAPGARCDPRQNCVPSASAPTSTSGTKTLISSLRGSRRASKCETPASAWKICVLAPSREMTAPVFNVRSGDGSSDAPDARCISCTTGAAAATAASHMAVHAGSSSGPRISHRMCCLWHISRKS